MELNNADAAFHYLESFTNLEKKTSLYQREYRLDRMKKLLELFDNPHKNLDIIHIAGSKGKGSTAAFAASFLSGLGFSTGLYTSPHIETYRERITCSSVFFDDSLYLSCIEDIKNTIENNTIFSGSEPTTFELLTLLAFLVFRKAGCTWAVIEAGLGGRLDATNMVTPACSVITLLELEHREILGNTLPEIAAEKAGIIKKNISVFSSRQKKEAETVLREKAEKESSEFYYLPEHAVISNINITHEGMSFKADFNDSADLSCTINTKMRGVFQAENITLAILAVYKTLSEKGLCRDKKVFIKTAEERALNVNLLGRMEIFPQTAKYPAVILDSSHTKSSAEALADTIKKLFPGKGILVFGSVEGKDHISMFNALSDCFSTVIVSKPGSFKKSSPMQIYNDFKNSGRNIDIFYREDSEEALLLALSLSASSKTFITVCGSFYIAAEIRKLINKRIATGDCPCL